MVALKFPCHHVTKSNVMYHGHNLQRILIDIPLKYISQH